jgi:hypothetical protein
VDHVIDGQSFSSFRITARRAVKTFPLTSTDLNRELGAHVLARRPEARVDLHHPVLNVHVEVLPHEAFCLSRPPAGAGGRCRWARGHGGGADLRGHRLARGVLAHDQAGLPRGLRPLPQRALPARRVDPEGAGAGPAPDAVAVCRAPLPRPIRGNPARSRAGGHACGPRGRLPPPDGPHCRGAGAPVGGAGARHSGESLGQPPRRRLHNLALDRRGCPCRPCCAP